MTTILFIVTMVLMSLLFFMLTIEAANFKTEQDRYSSRVLLLGLVADLFAVAFVLSIFFAS